MTKTVGKTNAEIIHLTVGIHGVGRKGDRLVYNPNDPSPEYRLLRFGSLDPSILPAIRKGLLEAKRLKDAGLKRERLLSEEVAQ